MSTPPSFDFAVIGAGIAGASLAFHLAGRSSVIVLERESQPGYHSTGRSAAMFMESYGTPAIRALTRASRAFYEQPPEGFAAHPLLTPRGALYIASEAQLQELQATFEALSRNAANVRLVTGEEAVSMVPVLRADRVHAAIFEQDAQDIDVHALHQGYLKGMRARGGTLRCNAELAAAVRTEGFWQLSLADGQQVQARTLVNAAGAWADQIADLCKAARVGLEPRRRSAFTFAAPEGLDCTAWPAVVGIDESFYFKPDAGQLLEFPGQCRPGRAARRGARGTGRGPGHPPHRERHHLVDPSPEPCVGRTAFLRAGRRLRARLGRELRRILLACRPGRLWHPDGGGRVGACSSLAAPRGAAGAPARPWRGSPCIPAGATALTPAPQGFYWHDSCRFSALLGYENSR